MTDLLIDVLMDTLKILPFLFLAYLLIEFIEDRAEEKTLEIVNRAGRAGPIIGSILGVIPQCGFSAATSNLYVSGIITRGTLIAVFLSTSDEMLPILISHSVPADFILKVLCYKMVSGMLAGTLIDFIGRKLNHHNDRHIHDMCEREGCKCEDGIFKSALVHTVKIFIFLLIVNLVLSIVMESIGEENIQSFILNKPVAGEFLAGLIGLIPNCAASVVITELYLNGGMSVGAMLSGLLVGSGVGLLVLVRMDDHRKDCLLTLGLLYLFGVLLGMTANLIPIF